MRNTVCKQHQIRTRKSRTRHQHAVEFEKVRSGRDRLRRPIFECFISGDIDTKICQFAHVEEAQRALRPDSQDMYLVLNEARPHRFERKSKANLGQSSVTLFAGVKNFQFSRRAPSAVCRRASQGDLCLCGPRAIHLNRRARGPVSPRRRALTDRGLGPQKTSGEAAFIETFDHGEYLIGAALVDKVDRSFAIQHTMLRIEPQPGFLGCIEL